MTTAAIIVAAGRGTRAGGDVPKQWQEIAGKRIVDWTLDVFLNHPQIDQVVLVVHPDDADLAPQSDKLIVAFGGATRSASVANGLEAIEGTGVDYALIHDVARPCVSATG